METIKAILILTFCLAFALPALAQDKGEQGLASPGCPDKVQCKQRYMDINGNVSNQTIGELQTESCYKFPTGCRPWHCKDNDTDWGYWQKKCNDTFPDCTRDHAHMTDPWCTPHFKTF